MLENLNNPNVLEYLKTRPITEIIVNTLDKKVWSNKKEVFTLKISTPLSKEYKSFHYFDKNSLIEDKLTILIYQVKMRKLESLSNYITKLKMRKAPKKHLEEALKEQELLLAK